MQDSSRKVELSGWSLPGAIPVWQLVNTKADMVKIVKKIMVTDLMQFSMRTLHIALPKNHRSACQ